MSVLCPLHCTPLSGGPIQYLCFEDGGHTVRAADIDHEFHPREAVA
jgi:hypothetical protein